MAMPLPLPPPPPRPPLGRGRLVGVGPPPEPAAASQAHRPLLPASLQLHRCRCHRSEGPWRRRATTTSGRRRWWSDEDMEEEDDEEEYGYDGDGPGGSAQELFGEPWFSRLFRAYGYVLPLLLASMLVATGPRAFLMAMALPLAQSAISWVVSFTTRMRGRQQESYGYDYDDDPAFQRREEDDDDDDDYYDAGTWQWQSRSYQQSTQSGSGFGGWDDLLRDDERQQQQQGAGKRTPPEPDAEAAASDLGLRTRKGPRRSNAGMSRGRSSSRRYNQAPLLTRLLVALFPFLGSWFRIL